MRFIHSYHQQPNPDPETMRRETLAYYTRQLAAQHGTIIPCPMGLEDAPRRFRDGDRDMVFVRDMIRRGIDQCTQGDDYVLLSNTDTCFRVDICEQMEQILSGGIRGFFGPRRDFQTLTAPLAPDQIRAGVDYAGNDLFVFNSDWWREHGHLFPDMIVGTEAWDCCLFKLMLKTGLKQVKDLVYHQRHPSRWEQPQNRLALPSQRHNLRLASAALQKLGVPYQPQVFGAIPRWTTTKEKTIKTWCAWHIGDNLIHLNFLRKVALANPSIEFIHAAAPAVLPQLTEIIEDAPNMKLVAMTGPQGEGVNAWKNTGGFWDRHPKKMEWVNFHLRWFNALSEHLGVGNPILWPDDLLMDSPAILKPTVLSEAFDVLLINGRPGSGQFSQWAPNYFDPVINALRSNGKSVICTAPTAEPGVPCTAQHNITCAGIGNLSLHCKVIVAVATGPMWPTANIWNRDSVQKRIILLERENVMGFMNNAVQVTGRDHVMSLLREQRMVR